MLKGHWMKCQSIFAIPAGAFPVNVFQAVGPKSSWFAVEQLGQLSTTMTVTEPPVVISNASMQAPQAIPFW